MKECIIKIVSLILKLIHPLGYVPIKMRTAAVVKKTSVTRTVWSKAVVISIYHTSKSFYNKGGMSGES